MKAAFRTLLCLGVVLAACAVVVAEDKDDKKKVTLKGDIGCAKCVFKVKGYKACTNAIKVKDGDKEVIYIFNDKGGKESYHKEICTSDKKGSVTGVIGKDKGKNKTITPDKDGVKFE